MVLATATSAVRDGAILDIGGGSAQLREIEDGRFKRGESHTIGALALDDRAFIRRLVSVSTQRGKPRSSTLSTHCAPSDRRELTRQQLS